MFTFLDTVTSTNDEALKECYHHGDIVSAEYQTAGRGQRGNRWQSDASLNLMFSAVLEPVRLECRNQFVLLETVALSLYDTFEHYGIHSTIKWTNDIYVGDRKITGVLIEQSVSDGNIAKSIAGIGINVNQTEFDKSLPNPTSMALECGKKFDRREVLGVFGNCLMNRYAVLEQGERESIHAEYVSRMYRLGRCAEFALPDGTRFHGTILRAEPSGDLVIQTDGGVRKFLFKEITFIL